MRLTIYAVLKKIGLFGTARSFLRIWRCAKGWFVYIRDKCRAPFVRRGLADSQGWALPEVTTVRSRELAVVLTSYPERFERLDLTLMSVLRQISDPRDVHLVLSEEEVASFEDLPHRIRKLANITIHLVPQNNRSYKKFVPTFSLLSAYRDLCIIDDDAIYESSLIPALLMASHSYPGVVVGGRGRSRPTQDAERYSAWPLIQQGTGPTLAEDVILTGCGGTLFPRGRYRDALAEPAAVFLHGPCANADDLYVHARLMDSGILVNCLGKALYRQLAKKPTASALYKTNLRTTSSGGKSPNDLCLEWIHGSRLQ